VLVAANVNQPKGNIDGPRQDYTLAADDQLVTASAYRPLLIAYRNGSPVRLSDIATVVDGVENNQLAGWANGKRAVIINVQRQPGANLIEVTNGVKKLLPQLSASMPQGIDVTILSDRTETVRASVDDVQFTLILTIGLVIAVIFMFLRNLRATIIPGVAVPLSLIGSFGVMYLLGYSLNNLTLMALTIATGFVVDDAIVMVENVSRFIEEGEAPFEAALKGAKQIGFTIVSLTVSLVAVLIPLLFMGGLIGRLFREFAVTLAVAIIVSAILSLTLTAMMCAHVLRHSDKGNEGRLSRLFESGFDRIVKFYDRCLQWVLNHQRLTLIVTFATVAFTALLALWIPKGFFPQQDTGLIIGVTEAPPDVSFPAMLARQQAVAEVIGHDPDVRAVASFIGADGTNPTMNSGRISITLKNRSDRKTDAEAIIARLQPRLEKIAGINVFLQSVQDLQVEDRVSRTQFQMSIEDADPNELAAWAPQILERIKALPEVRDAASDQQAGGLQLTLAIDRDTASRLGVTSQAIDDTLYDAFGQRQVSTVFTQLNLYRIILEVRPEDRGTADALHNIYVRSVSGDPVPLAAFTHFEKTTTPLTVSHQGQFPAVTVSFNLAPRAALGDAVKSIQQALDAMNLPPGLHTAFEGAARAFHDALATEPVLILAALITVYIVLGVLYESYIHPITILSTLPSAGVGAFLALILCRTEFSIIALIGIVLLIGIVKKNAIMMIDFALEAERVEGLSARESIHKACLLRFRPIMMTTMAALLGGIPLALGRGTGSELRRPLGIAIVGGLIISQLLTLFTTPVIYLAMERLRQRLTRKKTAAGGATRTPDGGGPGGGAGGGHGGAGARESDPHPLPALPPIPATTRPALPALAPAPDPATS
jgi:multidrug efflux pump